MEIHWHGLDKVVGEQREAIEERLRDLSQGHTDLIDIRLTGHTSGHHRHGAQEVRLTCQARGREIVAARTRPDLELALAEALDTFEHEVHRWREKRRDQARAQPPEPPHIGIVDRVFPEEGYGFILTDGGEQVYFHRNAVKHGLDFDNLQEADRVALNIESGQEGLQATVVLPPPT
jgi:cold shock CspA family protein/ribosome-associated translation inhibitor RaiA